MTWLRNEDAALKQKFNGLTVFDENAPPSGRPVAVRFRLAETELADFEFPLIVIDPPALQRAPDREHRGPTRLPYIPEDLNAQTVPSVDSETGDVIAWDPLESEVYDSPIKVDDFPVPFNLDYQVTVYTRKHNHLMELVRKLAVIDRIPTRFGFLEIPQDNTVRSLELMGGPELVPAKDSDGKRLFSAVYAVRVATEQNLYGYTVGTDFVQEVDLTLERIPESTD